MPPPKLTEEPDDSKTWELVERCLLPIAFSHAVAVILAAVLNTLRISQTSSFVLFLLFLFVSVGFTLFYHNLKVSRFSYCQTRRDFIFYSSTFPIAIFFTTQ